MGICKHCSDVMPSLLQAQQEADVAQLGQQLSHLQMQSVQEGPTDAAPTQCRVLT